MNRIRKKTVGERKIRIMIVGESELVRAGLRKVIEDAGRNLLVVDDVDLEQAPEVVVRKHPDVIIQDIDHSPIRSFDLSPRFLSSKPGVHILAVTSSLNRETIRKTYNAGASAVVSKFQPTHSLLSAIKTVCTGEVWIEQSLFSSFLDSNNNASALVEKNSCQPKPTGLTKRELDVVRLIGKGYRNKQIADVLAISEATVRHHLTTIYGRLGIAHRHELFIYGHKNKLIESEEVPGDTPKLTS
jgi:DNA-binding NarL/FixJ family response regulator